MGVLGETDRAGGGSRSSTVACSILRYVSWVAQAEGCSKLGARM